MALAPHEVYRPATVNLPQPTPEERALVSRAEARRIAVMGDQQILRSRYEEIMRWINPPWDEIASRPNPRPNSATALRNGQIPLHVDLVHPAVDRWAILTMGVMPVPRVKPKWTRPPLPRPDDPEAEAKDRRDYEIDRAINQAQSTAMENQTIEWAERANLHRTLLWAVWAKEAFGKAILRTGWDADEGVPTVELFENPASVYYGWDKRYGARKLAWAMVVAEMAPEEANRRFGLNLPLDSTGSLMTSTWTATLDISDMDQRPEQQQANQRFVNVEEYWEIAPESAAEGARMGVQFALILAGRVIQGPTWYPWRRLPFHVLENSHIPTWAHGKSTAEVVIPINESLDDTWDRQHEVIEFESGPRYKGLNMANSGDETDIPDPFHLVPLREGEDIQQIDTRVDFFPTQLHADQMFEGMHRGTGLTPIAWGMSPNAQTSGRAMSAEWRAVEIPLTGRIINIDPEIRDVFICWWDYAELWDSQAKEVAKGYRRFELVWAPLDIRDKSEKNADIINRLNANILDPETAVQESGYENGDELLAKIKAYLMDPIWNPLRYQQYLTLQQLELSIRRDQLEVSQLEAQAQPQQAPQQQGAIAAAQAAQLPTAGTESQNQPEQQIGGGGLPIDTSILSQTPLVGGAGNRAIVDLGGGGAPSPTAGVAVR